MAWNTKNCLECGHRCRPNAACPWCHGQPNRLEGTLVEFRLQNGELWGDAHPLNGCGGLVTLPCADLTAKEREYSRPFRLGSDYILG